MKQFLTGFNLTIPFPIHVLKALKMYHAGLFSKIP